MDKIWTWTRIGRNLDMDNFGTKIGRALLSLVPRYFTDKTWTKIGQIFVQGLSDVEYFGQIDKFLTSLRQILFKTLTTMMIFWQILDMDKYWTENGQVLDKTWTFVQNVSKFCPVSHSTGAPKNPYHDISRLYWVCLST